MRCVRVDRLIEPYLEERLSPSQTSILERHLTGCPACRARVAEASRLRLLLEEKGATHAPPGFAARVMSQVYEEEPLRPPVRARRVPAPAYRRLGYSFMVSAALLAVSLLIPRVAYPRLLAGAALVSELDSKRPTAVVRVLDDAGRGVGRVIDLQTRGSR